MVEISTLNDDLLGQILERVSEPGDRKQVLQVCKQWFTLEGLTRRSLTLYVFSRLRQVLPRFPTLVTFQTSQLIEEEADLEFIAQTCPKLEAIDLSAEQFESMFLPENGLYGLSSGGGLPKLSKVSVRGRWRVATDRWIHRFPNLTYLDLGECGQVDDDYALEAIALVCTCLRYLNLEKSEISDTGLRLLAHGRCSKTLNTLVLAYCKGITDSGVSHLQNMQCLEELVLESCGYGRLVTDSGVISAISGNPRSLQKLNLGWLKNVSDQSLFFVVENCPNLEFLDLSCSRVTGAGIRALSSHRFLESLVLRMWFVYYWEDVEHLLLECKSLKSLELSWQFTSCSVAPESLSRIVTLYDDWKVFSSD